MRRFEEFYKKKNKKKSLGFGSLASQCTFSVYWYDAKPLRQLLWLELGGGGGGRGGWRERRVVVGGQGEGWKEGGRRGAG